MDNATQILEAVQRANNKGCKHIKIALFANTVTVVGLAGSKPMYLLPWNFVCSESIIIIGQ